MVDRVVKSVEIREAGTQRVYDRFTKLTTAARGVSVAVNEAGTAIETNARKIDSAARSYERLTERTTSNSGALRNYASDINTVEKAHAAGITSAKQFATDLQRVQQALQSAGAPRGPSTDLQRNLEYINETRLAAKSAQESAEAMSAAFRAIDTGTTPLQNTINSLHGIGEGFLDAQASASAFGDFFKREMEEAKRQAEVVSAAISKEFGDAFNRRMNIGGPSATQMGASYSALSGLNSQLDLIERARTEQFAPDLNRRLGVGVNARDQGATVSALMEAEKAAEAYERRLAQVRAEIDPVAAAQDRLNAEIAEYTAMAARGDLTTQQLAQGMEVAQGRFALAERSLGQFKDASRLSSTELQNLQFQLNDIGVSLASGQSPFVVLLQQGAQIGQLFGPGATVQTALRSVASGVMQFLTSPINLAVLGFAALAGGVAYFVSTFKSNIPPLKDRIEDHLKLVRDLADAYGDASANVDKYGKLGKSALEALSARQREITALQLQSGASRILDRLAPEISLPDITTGEVVQARDMNKYPELEGALKRLSDSAKTGAPNVREFFDEIGKIGATTRDAGLRKLIADVIETNRNLVTAQDIIDGTVDRLGKLREAARKAGDAARDGLKEFVPDLTTDRQRIEQLYRQRLNAATVRVPNDPERNRNALAGIQIEADRDRKEALDEIARAEANVRRERELATQGIFARTTAERSAIAEQMKAVELNTVQGDKLGEVEREARIAAEGLLVFAQAQREVQDAARSAEDALSTAGMRGYAAEIAGINRQIERQIELTPELADAWNRIGDAQRAVATINMREQLFTPQNDNVASLKAEAEALDLTGEARRRVLADAQAEQTLRQAGVDLLSKEAEAYRSNARAISEYEAALSAAKAERDLLFERDQMLRTPTEQKVAEQLRSLNLSERDPYGKVIANQVRYNERLKEGKELIEGMTSGLSAQIREAKSLGDVGSILLDRVSGALNSYMDKQLEKALQEVGNSVLGNLFPGAGPAIGLPDAPAMQTIATANMTASVVNLTSANGLLGGLAANQNSPLGSIERGGPLAPVLDPASQRVSDAFAVTAPVAGMSGAAPSVSEMTAYIRQAAAARGIDQEIALRVARSEGLGEGIWQSNYHRGSFREPSYGPFQLLKGGPGTGFGPGLGNAFMQDTGLDPADRRTSYAGIDYALNHAAKNGWGAWYGADKAGVGEWDGLRGAQTVPLEQVQAQIQQSATALQQSAQTLAPAASQFTSSLGQQLNGTIVGGASQIADQFVPGLGGVVQTFLKAFQSAAPGGGGGLGSLIASAFGGGGGGADPWAGLRFAKGGAFTNSIVDTPTQFRFADGIGLMGEAGPEAIMPLSRGRNGRLGVTMSMQRAPQAAQPTIVENVFHNAPPVKEQREETDQSTGKRRNVIVFDEMVSKSVKGGPRTKRALGQLGAKMPLTR